MIDQKSHVADGVTEEYLEIPITYKAKTPSSRTEGYIGDGAHGVASAEGCVSAGRKILLLLHYLRTDL
ncbi:hypothetical protein HZ326_25501, partial [Fusarium oxysporum f. sp. albedinis]